MNTIDKSSRTKDKKVKKKGQLEEEKKSIAGSKSDSIKSGKSPEEAKEEHLLHPSRAESRSTTGRRRPQTSSHDTSGTSGSDTAGSDKEEPGARAVKFRVEYHDKTKKPPVSGKKPSQQPSRSRPEIVVSRAGGAIGRGGVIDTEG